LWGLLAAGGEFGHRPARRALRHLAAGIRVHLRVQDENVDVAAGRQHVIQATVADVVGPAVAADNPDAALHQDVSETQQVAHGGADLRLEPALELPYALALLIDTLLR